MNSGSKTAWFRNSAVWQVIFVLIILYNVSSINVLVLTVSILPVLQGAFLKSYVLVYFGEISFVLAVLLSIYHLNSIFRAKKRKNDNMEEQEKIGFGEILARTGFFSKLIFALIILYAIFSIILRAWALGNTSLTMGDDVLWIAYSLVSFGLATIIAANHLFTMTLRRKRKGDGPGR